MLLGFLGFFVINLFTQIVKEIDKLSNLQAPVNRYWISTTVFNRPNRLPLLEIQSQEDQSLLLLVDIIFDKQIKYCCRGAFVERVYRVSSLSSGPKYYILFNMLVTCKFSFWKITSLQSQAQYVERKWAWDYLAAQQ